MREIRVEEIGLDHAPVVQKIFVSNPEYFRKTDHSEVQPHFAVREMQDMVRPEKQSLGYQKVFCLISVDGDPIGVVDLHKNHPAEGNCYIGLLIIHGQKQREGYGRLVYPHIEQFVFQKLGCSEIVLGISEDNNAEGFWVKMGFLRNGHTYRWQGANHENQIFEMSKKVI